jgi:hypothetical protein
MKETSSTAQTPLVGDPRSLPRRSVGTVCLLRSGGSRFLSALLGNVQVLVEDWLRDGLSHSFQEIFARDGACQLCT